jgi:molybdate transport system substrate-binding protein
VVLAQTVGQSYSFVNTRNADLGFVAAARLAATSSDDAGSQWEVPESLHAPISQQAVLLRDVPTARELFDILRSEPIVQLIRDAGYTR